jgi:hypothetical protein
MIQLHQEQCYHAGQRMYSDLAVGPVKRGVHLYEVIGFGISECVLDNVSVMIQLYNIDS